MTTRILMISAPGDDRGPGVMYKNHLKAIQQVDSDISITHLTQDIWSSDNMMKNFDVAWGYVRFHPAMIPRLRSLGLPIIGGPNIAMERADHGITDEYENWYLNGPSVDINLNVAQYYSDHVKKFSTNGMKFGVLEGCYDVDDFQKFNDESKVKDIDVLLYNKVRVNDTDESAVLRLSLIKEKLKGLGLKVETINYGSYTREEYFDLCKRSKVVAWLSIEDYASLAQIEAHLLGACVVGTPYNLTIPAIDEAVCHLSQDMHKWISWRAPEEVSNDFTTSITRILQITNLKETVIERSKLRHGFQTYRKNVKEIIRNLK